MVGVSEGYYVCGEGGVGCTVCQLAFYFYDGVKDFVKLHPVFGI